MNTLSLGRGGGRIPRGRTRIIIRRITERNQPFVVIGAAAREQIPRLPAGRRRRKRVPAIRRHPTAVLMRAALDRVSVVRVRSRVESQPGQVRVDIVEGVVRHVGGRRLKPVIVSFQTRQVTTALGQYRRVGGVVISSSLVPAVQSERVYNGRVRDTGLGL